MLQRYLEGSMQPAGNYRPINFTSQVGKTMESILKNCYSLSRSCNLINDDQPGFTAKKLPNWFLIRSMEVVSDYLDKATQ